MIKHYLKAACDMYNFVHLHFVHWIIILLYVSQRQVIQHLQLYIFSTACHECIKIAQINE